jgi:hypothetical protein
MKFNNIDVLGLTTLKPERSKDGKLPTDWYVNILNENMKTTITIWDDNKHRCQIRAMELIRVLEIHYGDKRE